jgi:hypothetical protein
VNLSLTEVRLPGLWPTVWKLLRLRLIILLSGFRRANRRRKILLIFVGLALLAFLGFLLFLSWALLHFLRSPFLAQFVDAKPLLESVPVLIVAGAFLGILLTSFGVLLQALYLAGDMDFLLSAPVPIRAVFFTKMLQAILPNFSLICLFGLPVLFGLGISSGYNLLYYPLVLVMLAALALAAAGLSSLLVMFIVRIFPARRVAEVLGFFGAVFSIICSQSGQLANFGNFEHFDQSQATQAFSLVSRFNSPWSPLAWAGRGLVGIGEGHWLAGVGFSLLTLGLAGVMFWGALTTSERLYYTGWASMQGNRRKKKAPRRERAAAPRPLAGIAERRIPSPVRAILVKDFYVLQRDLRNMSQLITPLIFGIIYAIMFLRGGNDVPAVPEQAPLMFREVMNNITLYGNVGISLFVSWMLLVRLASMGFSQEGHSYWILKSAPVSTAQLLIAKFLVAFIPSVALAWLFLVAISLLQRSALTILWFTLPVVTLTIFGNTGLNLGIGVTGANMNWEDPRHMNKTSSNYLSTFAGLAYLPLSLLFFFGPSILFSLFRLPQFFGQIAGLLVGGAFSLITGFVPVWLVRRRVALLGE